MAKGRKRKDSAGENVEAYKQETETRKNAVPVGLSSYDTSRPKPIEDKEKVESIYRRVREILESARSGAYRAVNFAMVQAYWHIGRVIVEEEQRGKAKAEYGEYLLKNLSQRLTKDFGKGFDYSNVKNMRQFYMAFPIGDALRSQLNWTHYRLLMRVEKESVRNFYIEECIAGNWSTRQLERQINTLYYERILSSRDKEAVIQSACSGRGL